MKRTLVFVIFVFIIMFSIAQGEEDPITKLKNDTMLYFAPIKGAISGVEGDRVLITIGAKDSVRPGMRLKVLREGEPFVHPITKELLGRIELTVGRIEIKDIQPETSAGILVEGEAMEGDKVRISETKIKVFFCQDKSIDWYLADEYYRKLKATGRIEMIDTAFETSDEEKVLEKAREHKAEVALLLTAKESEGGGTLVREQLFWVLDGSKFADMEIEVGVDFTKELKFGEEFFAPKTSDAILTYSLPFDAKFVSTGDFNSDGKQEIIIGTTNDVKAYIPAIDLQFLWSLEGSAMDEFIWIDTIDLNGNGKDELIITSMKDDEIISYIYELEGSEFKKLWEGEYFLRRIGSSLLAQSHSVFDGFAGDIFTITWSDGYRKGEKVKVPEGINIYDFIYIKGAEDKKLIFAYDEDGFLNIYNEKGLKTWRSSSSTGGFLTTFKKEIPLTNTGMEEWSVKDKLIKRYKEVLVIERIPFLEMAEGIGYKNSRIRNYWWNGISMEDGILIDDIGGSVIDFALAGDRIIVLSSPFLGINLGNILKGKNPLGTTLFIYSIKGI